MKPESLAIFGFLVSLIAYEFLGLLVCAAVISSSVSSEVVVTGLLTIAILYHYRSFADRAEGLCN